MCLVLRQYRPELAVAAAIASGIAAVMVCMKDIGSAVQTITALADSAGMDMKYSSAMLRACGIALVAEFASQICQDAGESALAGRIKLALRLALSVMAAPMLADIISQSISLMQF